MYLRGPAISTKLRASGRQVDIADTANLQDRNRSNERYPYQLLDTGAQEPSHEPSLWTRLRPRGCFLIITVLFAFIVLSSFLGLYFTLYKEYGYSMGDSFTLAGYVIAVGGLISSFLIVKHYPRCNCWKRPQNEAGIEMRASLSRSVTDSATTTIDTLETGEDTVEICRHLPTNGQVDGLIQSDHLSG